MLQHLFLLAKREEGQDLAEYALLIGLIALVAVTAVTVLGQNVNAILQAIAEALGDVM